jgi:hypothetical protein
MRLGTQDYRLWGIAEYEMLWEMHERSVCRHLWDICESRLLNGATLSERVHLWQVSRCSFTDKV